MACSESAYGKLLSQIASLLLFLELSLSPLPISSQEDIDLDSVYVPELGRALTAIVCHKDHQELRCDNSSLVLVIYTATYGRKSERQKICPYDGPEWTPRDICGRDVTTALRTRCDKRKKCDIYADPILFGNPCLEVNKYLHIVYACVEKSKFKSRKHSPKPTQPLPTTSSLPTSILSTRKGTSTRLTITVSPTLTTEVSDLTTVRSNTYTDLTMVERNTSVSNNEKEIETSFSTTNPQSVSEPFSPYQTVKVRPSNFNRERPSTNTKTFYVTKSPFTYAKQQSTVSRKDASTKTRKTSTLISSLTTDPPVSLLLTHGVKTRSDNAIQTTDGTKRDSSAVTAAPGKDEVSSVAVFTKENRTSTLNETQGYVSIGNPLSRSFTPKERLTNVPSAPISTSTRPRFHVRSIGPYSYSSANPISFAQSTERNIVTYPAITSLNSRYPQLTSTIHTSFLKTKASTKHVTAFPGIRVRLPSNNTNVTDSPTVTSTPTTYKTNGGSSSTDVIRVSEIRPSTRTMATITSTTAAPPPVGALREEEKMGVVGSLILWFFYAQEDSYAYLTVFFLSGFGAGVIMAGLAIYSVMVKRRSKNRSIAVLHKPRRIILPPLDSKGSHQHLNGNLANRRLSAEDDPDGLKSAREGEVLISSADDTKKTSKQFNDERLSYNAGEDIANNNNNTEKPNFYLNPMYDNKGPNKNTATSSSKPPSRTSSQSQLNPTAGSGTVAKTTQLNTPGNATATNESGGNLTSGIQQQVSTRARNNSDSSCGSLKRPPRSCSTRNVNQQTQQRGIPGRYPSSGNVCQQPQHTAGIHTRNLSTGNVNQQQQRHQLPNQQQLVIKSLSQSPNKFPRGIPNVPMQGQSATMPRTRWPTPKQVLMSAQQPSAAIRPTGSSGCAAPSHQFPGHITPPRHQSPVKQTRPSGPYSYGSLGNDGKGSQHYGHMQITSGQIPVTSIPNVVSNPRRNHPTAPNTPQQGHRELQHHQPQHLQQQQQLLNTQQHDKLNHYQGTSKSMMHRGHGQEVKQTQYIQEHNPLRANTLPCSRRGSSVSNDDNHSVTSNYSTKGCRSNEKRQSPVTTRKGTKEIASQERPNTNVGGSSIYGSRPSVQSPHRYCTELNSGYGARTSPGRQQSSPVYDSNTSTSGKLSRNGSDPGYGSGGSTVGQRATRPDIPKSEHQSIISGSKLLSEPKCKEVVTSLSDLVSPLDSMSYGESARLSGRSTSNKISRPQEKGNTTSRALSSPPAPILSDSSNSDDDLYSIVAKGTYKSVLPDDYSLGRNNKSKLSTLKTQRHYNVVDQASRALPARNTDV